MQKKMIVVLSAAIIVIIATAHAAPPGKPDLTYNPSSNSRVIEYRLTGAYAPSPNEFQPTIIIYGDGTVIRKNGAYSFSTGKLPGKGVESILKTLYEKGFFTMKKAVQEGPRGTGGRSYVLTVNLKKGSHVESGDEPDGLRRVPQNWAEIVNAVAQPPVSSWTEYVPGAVLLVAHTGTPGTPGGAVLPWPCDGEDLAKAASAYPKGLKIEGTKASGVWKAFQEASRKNHVIVWKAVGRNYVDPVAAPQLP